MTRLNYGYPNQTLKMKIRKREVNHRPLDKTIFDSITVPGKQKRNGSFKTIALAMKFGSTLNKVGQKLINDPDIEINKTYKGVLKEFGSGLERFRKLVLMVCRMIRVIKVFGRHASDTGRPVHVGQMDEEKKHDEHYKPEHPLAFNPQYFALRQHHYHMEADAKRILMLPWLNRSDNEVQRVWRALRHLKEFRNMTSSMQLIMSRYARYEIHGKNRTIVRKGDPGRHYYFIYSGQVELRNSATDSTVKCPSLGPGKDFGHVALLHMERRTASIVCTEDTEFVVLDRRGNGRAVYRALLAEHKRKCSFLRTLDLFRDLDDASYRTLADHARLTEYLPTSLIATVARKHPYVYIIVEGVANVVLSTDVYSCCFDNKDQREFLKHYYIQRSKCNHKPEKLHDTFTQHDPKLSLVIQHLKKSHAFGMQHMLHPSANIPELHLVAKSKLVVMAIPVASIHYFSEPLSTQLAQEKYPVYPTVEELIRQYMEDSVWDLYKAHVIRDIKHFDGRVDPAKKCKYCLSCQLRSLVVPSIIPDPVRQEVTNLYCPGNTSPLPHLARQAFRPRSAPPMLSARHRKEDSTKEDNIPFEMAFLYKRDKTLTEITDYKPGSSGRDESIKSYEMRDSFCQASRRPSDRRPSDRLPCTESTRKVCVKFADSPSKKSLNSPTSKESVSSRKSSKAELSVQREKRSSVRPQSCVGRQLVRHSKS